MSLEQYYTEEKIGERLVSMLPCIAPESCLELSAGKGALLKPIVQKWPNIDISTCELDTSNSEHLKSHFAGIHYNIDVISNTFDHVYSDKLSSFDLAICNPPFSWRENNEYEKGSLLSFDMPWMCDWSKIRSEVIFTIQNIKLIKNLGVLAVILPELIVFSDTFSKFRRHLCSLCSIVGISELETGSFKGTEAKTFILVMVKGGDNSSFLFTRSNGTVTTYTQKEFCDWTSRSEKNDYFSIAESIFGLKRGRHTGKELRNSKIPFYHTSGFSINASEGALTITPERFLINNTLPVVGSKGDVLINRVGSRVIGKAAIVEKGNYAISDCVFRLSVPEYIDSYEIRDFWHQQSLEITKSSRGTCAQYLTKFDVLNHLARFLQYKSENALKNENAAIA